MTRNFRADGFPAGQYDACAKGWVSVSPEFRAGPSGEIAGVAVSLHMSTDDAVRLLAELPTAIIASSDTDETRALLRSTLASMLEALDGVGHA